MYVVAGLACERFLLNMYSTAIFSKYLPGDIFSSNIGKN